MYIFIQGNNHCKNLLFKYYFSVYGKKKIAFFCAVIVDEHNCRASNVETDGCQEHIYRYFWCLILPVVRPCSQHIIILRLTRLPMKLMPPKGSQASEQSRPNCLLPLLTRSKYWSGPYTCTSRIWNPILLLKTFYTSMRNDFS